MASEGVGSTPAIGEISELEEHLALLRIGDRRDRRKAVDAIRKICENALPVVEETGDGGGTVQGVVFAECARVVLPSLVACLQTDEQEYCRETATATVGTLVDACAKCDEHMLDDESIAYLLPAIAKRLQLNAINQLPLEPSEEVRLLHTKLLNRLITILGSRIVDQAEYVDDVTAALMATLRDPFAEIKRESCSCVVNLAVTVTREFHRCSHLLVGCLIRDVLVHQHAKVRIAGVQAVGVVVQHGSSDCLKDVFPHVAQRQFDPVPQVRKAVTCVVGKWIVSLPDRYSCYGRLVPLLLSGLSDEVEEIRELARTMWHDAGGLYLEENKRSLQDRIDYDRLIAVSDETRLGNDERPPLGCRILATNNFSYILPAVVNDLRDWKVAVRVKSAQLLRNLLLHVEDRMVPHLQKILSSLISCCGDEEPAVVSEVVASTEIVGGFVSADVWWKLLEGKMNECSSAVTQHLMVLAALVRGSRIDQLSAIVEPITSCLANPGICQGTTASHVKQVLECVKAIMRVGDECRSVSFSLFYVLLTVQALCEEETSDIKDGISCLSNILGAKNVQGLCISHANEVFARLECGMCEMWTAQTPEWLIFNVFLRGLGSGVVNFADNVMQFFSSIVKSAVDNEMKFRCIQTVCHMLMGMKEEAGAPSQTDTFSIDLIQVTILPHLEWHAGKAHETVRAAAVTVLYSFFKHHLIDGNKFAVTFGCVIERLRNLAEDDNKTTRLLVCKTCICCMEKYPALFESEHFLALSTALLKRMDDCVPNVRLAAAEALGMCLHAWLASGCCERETHHLESTCTRMLIFLNDSDKGLRHTTLCALKKVSECDARLVKTVIDKSLLISRSPPYQETWFELVEHIEKLCNQQ